MRSVLMRAAFIAVFSGPLYVSGQCRVAADDLKVRSAAFSAPGSAVQPSSLTQGNPIALQVLGGVVGGALGIAVGGFAAKSIYDSDVSRALGMAIGETVLVPVGVHLANESLGDGWLVFAGSYGVAALGTLVVALFADSSGENVLEHVAIGTIAAQIIVTVAIERATTRSREMPQVQPAPAVPGTHSPDTRHRGPVKTGRGATRFPPNPWHLRACP